MKENYYALLICIIRPEYNIDKSLKFMMEGKIARRNNSLSRSDVKDMISMKQQGMTYEEIGEIYGLTKGAVYRRIKRFKETQVV